MTNHAYAVVLAGGRGERFWPLSTRRRPKQLLALVSRRTLLAEAVSRVRPLVPLSRILVITRADLAPAVRRAVPALLAGNIIGEPCGRDTAAAITLAAAVIKARDPRGVFCVLTADHVIGDEPVFRRTLGDALARAAEQDALFTIGLKPTAPSTGFGYIEAGPRVPGRSTTAFFRVRRFVEKPGEAAARRYVASGRYFWNSGMFAWSLDAWERALRTHRPPLARLLDTLVPRVGRTGFRACLARAYAGLERISVDYAVLEKADNIVMAEGRFAWDDVGAWSALERHAPRDAQGNTVMGRVELLEASGNIVVAPDGLVALVGVTNLVVVRAGAATLVCRKDCAQAVKRMVEQIGRRPDAGRWL